MDLAPRYISAEYVDRIVDLSQKAIVGKEVVEIKVVQQLLDLVAELRAAKGLYFY